jgi:chromosome segregation ATPase
MTGKLLALVVVLALGTGLVGGLVGTALFSGGEDLRAVEEELATLRQGLGELNDQAAALTEQVGGVRGELAALESRLTALEGEVATLPTGVPLAPGQTPSGTLALAYVDLTSLVEEIFTPIDQAVEIKRQDLADLQARHEAGEIDDATYQRESLLLEIELLAVPLHWYLDLIQRMIDSPEFADIKAPLEELLGVVQPLETQLEGLRTLVQAEQPDMQSFLIQYQQLSAQFQQLKQLLSQTLALKFIVITQEVARAGGYAVVLRREEALYLDQAQVADLTPQVRARLEGLLPAS